MEETTDIETPTSSAMPSSVSATKKKQTPSQACEVCGDSAFGRNFGVFSCESCKAFFRRNSDKRELFGRCGGKCSITVDTRTFCKKCRLKKCFNVGMCMAKEGRGRGHSKNQYGTVDSTTTVDAVSLELTSATLIKAEPLLDLDFEISDIPNEWPPEKLSEPLRQIHDSWEQSFNINHDALEKPSVTEFVNLIERPIRQLIKFAKYFPEFKKLESEDQLRLIKSSVPEAMVINSAIFYDAKLNSLKFTTPDGKVVQVSPECLMNSESEVVRECYIQVTHYATKLSNLVQGDFILVKALIMLCLFSPDRGELLEKMHVEEVQERYAQSLYEYVRLRYSNHCSLYGRLMDHLINIRGFDSLHKNMLKAVDISQLTPVVAEIFGIS